MESGLLSGSTLSNSSTDSNDAANVEYYRTKISDLMKMIAYYQKVVKREQARNESLQSVNESMRDTRQSSGELQLQLLKKDDIIAVLQTRLEQLGASSDITLSADETVLLPSRENFQSLVQENIKLRANLKYTSFDPNGYEILQQQLRASENDLYQLQAKHRSLQTAYEELKKTFKLSEDEKDVQIYNLTEQLHEADRNTDLHSTLCQSLTDEAQELREQLQEVIAQCHKLERTLASKTAPVDLLPHQHRLGSDVLTNPFAKLKMESDESSELADRIKAVEKENCELKAQLHACKQELEKVSTHNANWQTYNSQRETHVVSLQKKIGQLTDQLVKARAAQDTGFSDKQQQEVDKIVLQYKSKLEDRETARQSLEDENRELRRERLHLQRSREQCERELQELRQNMQALSGQIDDASQYKERSHLLEEQLKIFNEDFQTERRDREQAMSKVADLEAELRRYKDYYERSQRAQMDDIARRRQEALSRYEREYYQQQQHRQLLAREGFGVSYQSDYRIEADGDESQDDVGEDVIDMVIQKPGREPPVRAAGASLPLNLHHANNTTRQLASSGGEGHPPGIAKPRSVGNFEAQGTVYSSSRNRNVFGDSRSEIGAPGNPQSRDAFHAGFQSRSEPGPPDVADSDNDTLQCPKCQLAFKADQHLDLLDHINDCCM